jgi:hypothetical protein
MRKVQLSLSAVFSSILALLVAAGAASNKYGFYE